MTELPVKHNFYASFDVLGSELVVLQACPNCHRFIKCGSVQVNGLEQVKLVGWICSKCGEVEPEWTFIE